MPVKPILWGLLFILGVGHASSQPTPTVRVFKTGEIFRFEVCEKTCRPLGRESGYTRAELENWKKFRSNTAADIAPLMFFAGAIPLLIGSIVLFPLAAVASISALALGGFAYFFSQSPQVQARMPNDVYHEFQADPALLPSLESYLRELDQGIAVLDQQPSVLSGRVNQKIERPQLPGQAPPNHPNQPNQTVKHAR